MFSRCQRPQVPQLFSHDLHREQVYGQKERQETGQYAFPQFHSFFSLSLCIQTLVCASTYRTVPLSILQQNSTHFARIWNNYQYAALKLNLLTKKIARLK